MLNKLPIISNNIDDTVKYLLCFIAGFLLLIAITGQLLTHRFSLAIFNGSAILTWITIYFVLKHKGYINPLRSYKALILTIGIFTAIGILLWGTSYQTLTTLFIVVLLLLTSNSQNKLIFVYGIGFVLLYTFRTIYEVIVQHTTLSTILDNTLEVVLLIIIIQQVAKINYLKHIKQKINTNKITLTPLLAHLIKNVNTNKSQRYLNLKFTWKILMLVLPVDTQTVYNLLPNINNLLKQLTLYISPNKKVHIQYNYSPSSLNTFNITRANIFFLATFEAIINALKYGENPHIFIDIKPNKYVAKITNSIPLSNNLAMIQKEQIKNTIQNISNYIKSHSNDTSNIKIYQKHIINKIIVHIQLE